jgi:hypothetical protein
MNISRIACLSTALFALSCAETTGGVTVDATYNLTCPDGSAAGCGALAPDTCLGSVGQRSIVGSQGATACTGDYLAVACEAVDRPDGRRFIALEAFVGDEFAFALDAILGDGSVEDTCHITIIEDGADYGGRVTGGCGTEPPSVDQPCQLTNVSTEGGAVEFDIECESLLSDTSGLGFDVGAVGGGPTRIKFGGCTGF